GSGLLPQDQRLALGALAGRVLELPAAHLEREVAHGMDLARLEGDLLEGPDQPGELLLDRLPAPERRRVGREDLGVLRVELRDRRRVALRDGLLELPVSCLDTRLGSAIGGLGDER